MKIKKKQLIILIAVLAVVSFFLLFSDMGIDKNNQQIHQISVIVRGENKENWSIIKQGIDQAAIEMNADINFITLTEENNTEEQKLIIRREIDNGADGILIAPSSYEEMALQIESISRDIPVVLIESRINTSENIPYISCDNYALGVKLAEEIISRGNTIGEIGIIKNSKECSSIEERCRGFVDTIKNTNNTFQYLDFLLEDKASTSKIEEMLRNNLYDVVISFDSANLELIGNVKKNLSKSMNIKSELYGVGSTRQIIGLVEEGTIVSIAVQNEFNIGYLGVKTVIDMKSGRKISNNFIEYRIITEKNMYSEENQRFLFPFTR